MCGRSGASERKERRSCSRSAQEGAPSRVTGKRRERHHMSQGGKGVDRRKGGTCGGAATNTSLHRSMRRMSEQPTKGGEE